MREIRQSGSEGGGNEQTVSPYPYVKPGQAGSCVKNSMRMLLAIAGLSMEVQSISGARHRLQRRWNMLLTVKEAPCLYLIIADD